jgi:preprotein translocase subunit YajC
MLSTLILFAQEVEEGAKKAPPGGIESLFSNPMMLLLILMALFFFVVILPQQRRQRKEQEALLAGMKKNDEVLTASGIIGVISTIQPDSDQVTLKLEDNARVRVLKSSIVRILKKEEPKEGAAAASAPASPGTAPANTNIKPT